MENDELKKMLKNDVPFVSYDSKAILQRCKQENNKIRIHKKRMAYMFSSIIILFILIFGIVFMNYRLNKEVIDINNDIKNLGKIDDNETRMLEIMRIETEVNNLSDTKRNKIDLSKLSFETNNTTLYLKNSVGWNNELNDKIYYYSYDEIISKREIKELYVKKSKESNVTFKISNELSNNLIKSINLPYIDIINNKDTFYNDYKLELSGNIDDYCNIQVYFKENSNESFLNIYVYGSGYVLITETTFMNNEEVLIKAFISLIPLDYTSFKETYGAYNINSEFYFSDIVNVNDIEFITIVDSTNEFILGKDSKTLTNVDEIDDYYKKYLKDLMFVENNELVNSINSKEGDTMSITVALSDESHIALFINVETAEYYLVHEIMSYAGIGKFKIE